jgi:Protein of unknown function (DUF3108)
MAGRLAPDDGPVVSRSLALPPPRGSGATAPGWSRRAGWALLVAAVVLGHGAITLWLQQNLVGWGDADSSMPQRIEVAYVRALAPAAPPPPATAARAQPKPTQARRAEPAASAPTLAASDPEPEAPKLAEAVAPQPASEIEPASDAASEAVSEAVAAAAVDEPAASAPAAIASAPVTAETVFEWPPSTRLTYVLTGNYRGEVHGNARVQWVRQGFRYQVHLDITIGPSFAPLISRRMTSDGELGEQGLTPLRYDEATRLPFQTPRRISLHFTPDWVTLANGSQQAALPGVQDAASQFVQLTWLFTTQPELLRAGNTVTVALALPRRVGRWIYDVLGQERLATPVGEIDTFHLKPRLGQRRHGNELSAEIWFAPSLQYLPVRIRIQQDADTYVDLALDSAPMQAAPAAEASAPR